MNERGFRYFSWTITAAVVALALLVWWPATKHLTSYSLFPLFGLLGFSLMWVHFVLGAAREYLRLSREILRVHFMVTSYIVLLCILVHPLLLELQLYLDGFGLPFQSLPAVYPRLSEQLAILAGVAALGCFLLFELHRFYRDKEWWMYIEWTNIGAMALILLHGFTLGTDLRQPWFQAVWAFYGVTFAVAVAYSGYNKRSPHYGRKDAI